MRAVTRVVEWVVSSVVSWADQWGDWLVASTADCSVVEWVDPRVIL